LPAERKFKLETNMDFMQSPYYCISVTKYEGRKWICYKDPVPYRFFFLFLTVVLLSLVML